ncbi:polyprenyl synthetase family protein [Streptococcus pluranimalium]|uniref:Farnesyl diphosphate synthase n=1 Tax=Streptococcus pluranimalium TaxID=82348 RepID=A0A345VLI9_9STRE|nr:farnesyl diphosphate synthase [Streptococcus pluranimalium]AXJ13591.1 Farnesyl diphosphate synthase [Streptococcus pluranimalium]
MDKMTRIDQAIRTYYQSQDAVSKDLIDAILYSVDSGGKRIRPMILLDLLEGFGIKLTEAHFDVAAALEMIHTGSLIHDDLPAMDNDDYRRGRLTNHKKFDEATAILAADSLFLDAPGLIAEADLEADIKVSLIQMLSRFSGTFGMVGGQMLDMKGEGQSLTLEQVQLIHANKTGALIVFPFLAAGRIAKQSDKIIAELGTAGQLLGLAFQVRDDILDVIADFEAIGKTPNKDIAADKSTYPALLGVEKSYEILDDSLDQAVAIFQNLEEETDFKAGCILPIIERLRLHA